MAVTVVCDLDELELRIEAAVRRVIEDQPMSDTQVARLLQVTPKTWRRWYQSPGPEGEALRACGMPHRAPGGVREVWSWSGYKIRRWNEARSKRA